VEFYVDGVRVSTDGNFPFEHRFVTPRLSPTKTNFTVRAKATDTGGNFAWSDELLVALALDATPPRLTRVSPMSGVVVTQAVDTVFAYFNEAMDAATLNAASFLLRSAGPDNRLGTADDVAPAGGTVSYRETLNAAVLAFPAPLPLGLYRAVITAAVTDAAGNHFTNQFTWSFAYLGSGPDGDDDGDDVTNAEELSKQTNPFLADTDGDGWSDRVEIDDGTDPLNPASRPRMTFVARPPVLIDLPSAETFGTAGNGVFIARPPVLIDLPSLESFGTAGVGTVMARPPVLIDLPSAETFGIAGAPLFLARPPLLIDLPSPDTAGTNTPGLFLARPPVAIVITNSPSP